MNRAERRLSAVCYPLSVDLQDGPTLRMTVKSDLEACTFQPLLQPLKGRGLMSVDLSFVSEWRFTRG